MMENYRPPLKKLEVLVFIEAPFLRQWDMKSLSSRHFARLKKSFFDITFGMIINRAQLMELLMLFWLLIGQS